MGGWGDGGMEGMGGWGGMECKWGGNENEKNVEVWVKSGNGMEKC